jgi:hypothetical protein
MSQHQSQRPTGSGGSEGAPAKHAGASNARDLASALNDSSAGVPGADALASPFIWQDGSRLLLLVRDERSWTLAELWFMSPECRYFERWRAQYAWPREAAGALLARAILTDPTSRGRLARGIAQWFAEIAPDSIDLS